jgi:hypothetical protein
MTNFSKPEWGNDGYFNTKGGRGDLPPLDLGEIIASEGGITVTVDDVLYELGFSESDRRSLFIDEGRLRLGIGEITTRITSVVESCGGRAYVSAPEFYSQELGYNSGHYILSRLLPQMGELIRQDALRISTISPIARGKGMPLVIADDWLASGLQMEFALSTEVDDRGFAEDMVSAMVVASRPTDAYASVGRVNSLIEGGRFSSSITALHENTIICGSHSSVDALASGIEGVRRYLIGRIPKPYASDKWSMGFKADRDSGRITFID